MSDSTSGRRQLAQVTATAEQRATLYELVRQDAYRGLTKAARMAGIEGTRGQIGQFLDDDSEFQEVLEAARADKLDGVGLGIDKLLTKLGWIVGDDGNSSQLRAIERGLHLHGIRFHEKTEIEHTGEVRNPDVADAVDRLNALVSAAAVRLASTGGAERDPLHVDRRGDQGARLPVVEVDRTA